LLQEQLDALEYEPRELALESAGQDYARGFADGAAH
jgi:hypothetical protein